MSDNSYVSVDNMQTVRDILEAAEAAALKEGLGAAEIARRYVKEAMGLAKEEVEVLILAGLTVRLTQRLAPSHGPERVALTGRGNRLGLAPQEARLLTSLVHLNQRLYDGLTPIESTAVDWKRWIEREENVVAGAKKRITAARQIIEVLSRNQVERVADLPAAGLERVNKIVGRVWG